MKSTIPTWKEYNNNQQFNIDKEELMSLPKYDLDNVEDKGRKEYPEGEYFFEIKSAIEKKATTGTEYTSLVLAVDIDGDTVNVYDNVFYSEKALFRLKQIVDATGMKQPEETDDYIGESGKAKFVVGEKGYLEVKWYISKSDAGLNSKSVAAEVFKTPSVADVPF